MINYNVYDHFTSTGDWMRSSRPNLETVINSGVRTVLYDGDADYICNYMGFEAMVRAPCFLSPLPFRPYADPCHACADHLLKYDVLVAVREAELCDLYRQWQACWPV